VGEALGDVLHRLSASWKPSGDMVVILVNYDSYYKSRDILRNCGEAG
jgi:hypothetical protein